MRWVEVEINCKICGMCILIIFTILGGDLQEMYRDYYAGFLLGGLTALIYHDFRVWLNHNDTSRD